ncbi:COX15/CtaA family protein [Halegenticoccus soli]|uniref:COX15/CtaA family protein n=1 Tax=Halegenticoccus soli TaxID=1985678 RepID=UPI003742F591
MTVFLIMLGVYTAATGSGLACSAQWPLCDNGLLPQTVPSFVEWFHRLVAMIAGFFILGTALWAWRTPDPRTRTAATLAVVLLPLQISIGAVTVTLNGMLPSGYSPPTQAAHLLVALAIFTLLVFAVLFAYEGRYRADALSRVRGGLLVSLALLPLSALFSRVTSAVLPYSPAAQAAFIGSSLVLFAALVAVTHWVGGSNLATLRAATLPALGLVFVHLLLGRDLVFYTPTMRLLNVGLLVATGALLVGAAWLAYRRSDVGPGRASYASGD